MSQLIDPTPPPRVKRWTKAEYNDLVDRGFFQGKPRVYLFRGELIEMTSMGHNHAKGTGNIGYVLTMAFPRPAYRIRVQLPFETPGESMPEPDGLVCTEDAENRLPHPNEALLVVEISDSSLALDRDKALDYAAARVREYWIVDVVRRALEVYRDPIPDLSTVLGWRYSTQQTLRENESVSPLTRQDVEIAVAELLP